VRKRILTLGVAALALALVGCGGGGNSTTETFAPLTHIPAPNNGDWTRVVTMTPEGTYVMGNPAAPVKLVEYASITCPHCGEFSETGGAPLRDTYVRSGQVSWEYRPYLLFPSDPGIFLMLRCLDPAAFFHTSEQIYADQRTWLTRLQATPAEQQQAIEQLPTAQKAAAYLRASGLDAFFRQRGVPEARMNQCLADENALRQLGEIKLRGDSQDGVTGTPTFIVNGAKQEAGSWLQLEPLLRRAIG
jgi:protein-disulfide isomerase